MERKRIYLSSPTMHGEEQAFVQSAFDTNWVAPLGPNVDAFEKEMADYIGGGYAAALSAGTAAIHLAVILAGVKEGDVVFAQSLTFAASVNPACYEKAKPVFIDSEPDTWNMDPVALEKAFEKYPHPAAVSAVKTAATILTMYLTLFFGGAVFISVYEDLTLSACLYETASAVGTVGLTLGITPQLHIPSQIVLIVLMYLGRVGGLTLIYAAFSGKKINGAKLPQEKIMIG